MTYRIYMYCSHPKGNLRDKATWTWEPKLSCIEISDAFSTPGEKRNFYNCLSISTILYFRIPLLNSIWISSQKQDLTSPTHLLNICLIPMQTYRVANASRELSMSSASPPKIQAACVCSKLSRNAGCTCAVVDCLCCFKGAGSQPHILPLAVAKGKQKASIAQGSQVKENKIGVS